MSSKTFRITLFAIVLGYFFTISIFYIISYNLLIGNFKQLQLEKNRDNVITLLSKMNTRIEAIANAINDYSKWDNSYKFMNDLNKEYIYENFREGTLTLENLNIDFIIYADLKQKVVFSKYAENVLQDESKELEKTFLEKFKNVNDLHKITKFKSNIMYLVKSEILKSDESGEVNGYIYSGKLITSETLEELTSIFKKIELSHNQNQTNGIEMKFSHLKNIKVSTSFDKANVLNRIDFYNDKNEFIVSIKTYNDLDIINNGEHTIRFYNIIISIFILIIFVILHLNQMKLITYNKRLRDEVNKRTKELNKSLREIEHKNKELLEISNIDYLTKIRNRRNFFIESEILLQRAIKENKEFAVLMIDIDYFKNVNDTYGHNIGDKVLIEFCQIVNSTISDKEIFGRLGGEEFCITFFDKDIEFVDEMAEELRKQCENSAVEIENGRVKFTISLGLANRKECKEMDQILQVSDKLLYEAKNNGRNRLVRKPQTRSE